MFECAFNFVISPIPIVNIPNPNCIMARYFPTRDTNIPDKADIMDDAREYGNILIASQLLTRNI